MDVLFDESEQMLQQSAREMLERESTPDLARAMEADPTGYSAELWAKLAELGWLGMALPEEYGGQGLGLVYLGIVSSELGRAVAPVPFHPTVVTAMTVARAGSEEQRQQILPRVASGETILTWAFTESDPRFLTAEGITLVAEEDGDEYVLNGTKRFVEHFENAEQCLVVCRTAGSQGDDGITLLLVDTKAPGISTEPLVNIAKDRLSEVTFSGVRVPKANVVGTPGAAWPEVQTLIDHAAALMSMQAAGGARKALELAVEYAKYRTAFDRPIGSFQAISHTLADTLIWIDGCELVTYEALWRLEHGLPAGMHVSQAKSFTSEKCLAAVRNANVVHGGVAATWELNLNLWFRRVSAWCTRFGTAYEHRTRVASAILDHAA